MNNFKTQIKKNSRVLVKTRNYSYDSWKIKEGIVVDAHKNNLKIEFRFWIFKYQKWFSTEKTDYQEISFLKLESEKK
jgi:hypothetical protein